MDFCNIYLIQRDLYKDDREILKKNKSINYLGDDKSWIDFEDTSAIVKNMDVIVSIDTSLIHLSASMQKKSFLILSKPADWRWSKENIGEPRWYNNLKIIRQKDNGSWQSVISELYTELKKI